MKSKRVLIGLSVGALMASVAATIFAGNADVRTYAEPIEPGNYSAEISSSNRLKTTSDSGWYGIRLHGGQEYGFFYVSDVSWLDLNPTGEYSDYAFSWTKPGPEGNRYFEITLGALEESSYYRTTIDGKQHYVRGFPGAYRITTVYSESSSNLDVRVCPSSGWTLKSKTTEGNLITAVAEKNNDDDNYSKKMTWTLWDEGTIYIKSITIDYTC